MDGDPPTRQTTLARRWGRLAARVSAICLFLSVFATALYGLIPPPVTPLMVIRSVQGYWPHRDWVAYDRISPQLARAVIAAEDARFCQHRGFDWQAIQQAWARNQTAKYLRGGSSISNQTAKNVFLWPGRSYLRKGLEFYFTFLIELMWSKKRILEVYLNAVEFGPGLYGAEAAAQAHFGKSASELTRNEAALLAAVLPSPLGWSASKPSGLVRSRAATIRTRMNDVPDPTGDPCGLASGKG
jgi:monofunctional glycosyltransferase